MERLLVILAIALIHFAVSRAVFAQITINVPKIPKIGKPKPDSGREGNNTGKENGQVSNNGRSVPNLIYGPMRPTSTPAFIKSSVYVQAKTHNEYWKMKGQSNYSSWVPLIRFNQFYNEEKQLNYSVDYVNPDGSAWYSEKLESSGRNADRTVLYQSPSPWGGVLDTKSTAATGVFSFRIKSDDTGEVIYQGKFKVGKVSTANGRPDKNKFDFFVDHDWLLPYGTIGFHHAIDQSGAMPLLVSFWINGSPDASDLEGRMFFNGKQIASTVDGGGASAYDERTTDMLAAFSAKDRWQRWQFQWRNVLFDNNGTFNKENFQNAFFMDKNPGAYTVKVFHKGTQIREMSFTVGADGRYAKPAYSDQVFIPYHTILLPAKVSGADPKTSAVAWKTDSFYGNPIMGFLIQ
ncbi:MAG TPA: hypothetical protein VFZ49_06790 [Pyrinomonadaceae bacterium]